MKKIRICAYCGLVYDKAEKGANKYCSEKCLSGSRRDKNRARWRRANGIETFADTMSLRQCAVCGASMAGRKYNAIYCGQACRTKANDRKRHRPMEEWIAERRVKLDLQIAETEIKKQKQRMIESAERRFFSYRSAKCAECGSVFGTYQPNQKTCSTECSKRRKRRRNDKRLNHTNMVDRDITLATLFKRDKGICYICGDPCDYNDYTRDGNNVTVGITYPTIDHLIPLARGGMHSWDNVRLAHHHCNSVKSDTVPDDIKQILPDDAYILSRKVSSQRKQVKQYTKDGILIAVYESTAKAAKQTGLNSKGIQNCARGERPSQGGYLWSY